MVDEVETQPEANTAQNLLEKAEAVAKKIEEANKKTEELLKRQEEIQARNILGGRSTVTPPEAPKVESAKDYAERIMNNKPEVKK